MARALLALLLLPLLARAQETAPAGITCCDEGLIRQAMTEEALRRVVARAEGNGRGEEDYLTLQAAERIRGLLPTSGGEPLLAFLRRILAQPGPGADIGEFQKLVGHFVLGMTLEIGHTFQFEYDQAEAARRRAGRLLAELEGPGDWDEQGLDRALFRAEMGIREFHRLRSLPGRWRDPKAGASPFDEFSAWRRNVTGLAPDLDQKPVFQLAAAYNERFPFLDEFLAHYRKLAGEFRAIVLELNERLAIFEKNQ